jgi:DNA polymerase-1
MAHVSGDERLRRRFHRERTRSTAASVWSLTSPRSPKERKAKAINFGILYGMGPFNLARQIGVGLKMAKQYLEDYYAYPVRRFMEELPSRRRMLRHCDSR